MQLLLLYRYFAVADYFRKQLIAKSSVTDLYALSSRLSRYGESGLGLFFISEPGIYLSYSYATMQIVIEGWKKLGLSDPRVDELLKSPHVESFRRFRNATFHFQKDLVPKKLWEFILGDDESSSWLSDLTDAFSDYFKRNMIPIPDELCDKIKGKTGAEQIIAIDEFLRRNPATVVKLFARMPDPRTRASISADDHGVS